MAVIIILTGLHDVTCQFGKYLLNQDLTGGCNASQFASVIYIPANVSHLTLISCTRMSHDSDEAWEAETSPQLSVRFSYTFIYSSD